MAEIAVSLAAKQAEGLVTNVVNKLSTIVSGELSLLLGVRGEIKFIRDELKVMSAFLRGAEEIQDKDPAAMAWAEQVKELAYAAEDCIDEFSLHLTRRRSTNLVAALWQRAGSLCSLGARRRIAANIQSIKSEVEEVSRRRLRYNINHKPSSTSNQYINQRYDPRSSALFVEDSKLVGIDGPREKLIGWLLEDNSNLSLIAVVGADGLGKTTLAKKIFDSSAIREKFSCHAWITVSQMSSDHDAKLLIRDMIKQFSPSPLNDVDKMERPKLVEELRGHLNNKKYVIVFDDIWKIDAWKSLKDTLPENKNGSRIIITTRNIEVARNCVSLIKNGHIHEQEKLSKEQSWDLFCRRFSLDVHTCPEGLKSQSESILKKCDGLPQVIVAVAAALASKPKKTSREWEKMLKHLSSELESNPNLQEVMQILNFSYIDLPYHVKQCFLYLSKFPEDTEINSNRIKRLWIAEGLVSGRRGMTTEEVAECYLNELINRCMIIPSVFSVKGGVKSFKIQDMMLEMIVSKSREENFFTVLLQKDSIWMPQEMVRRLSINNEHIPEDLTRLRSLAVFGDVSPPFLFKYSAAFRLLRVLEVENCEAFGNEHFKVICQLLLHLKYLSLRNTVVDRLPSSIRNLCYLETLCIRGAYIDLSPSSKIHRLERLRFLSIKSYTCLKDKCKFLPKIGRMRNLQELGHVIVTERRMMEELSKLNQLRKLQISIRYWEDRGSVFCEWLENLSSTLRSLTLYSDMIFLNDLKSPPLGLESLKLRGPVDTLPDWIGGLKNMVKLTLEGSEIKDEGIIQTLGRLPNLIKLQLHWSYIGERLCFSAQDRFPYLNQLVLKYLECEVVFEQGALPCLTSLTTWGTRSPQGIENLSNLKEHDLRTYWLDVGDGETGD